MSDLELQPLESHITKITKLIEILEENNQPIDNIAYIISKEQGNELAIELRADGLLTDARGRGAFNDDYQTESFINAGLGWKLIQKATYLGMRVIVDD